MFLGKQTHLLLVIHFHHAVAMSTVQEVSDPKEDGVFAADVAEAWCEPFGVFPQRCWIRYCPDTNITITVIATPPRFAVVLLPTYSDVLPPCRAPEDL